jgi:hypothetical protein
MREGARPWYARWWAIALFLSVVLLGTGWLTIQALGLRSVAVDAEPMPLPAEGFDYAWWNDALGRWVRPRGVDYAAVLEEQGELRRFVATLASTGPRTAPDRFSTEPEQLAYYLNAYNALTLFGVVDNWPMQSVHDVRGWLDPRAGFGFFYGLQFPLDGAEMNLYELENTVIRRYLDARIHAAINCASKSCPALAPYAFEAATLDEQLDVVTRAFCSNAPHVVIDEEAQQIRLSAIFDWYKADFEEHARRLGRPATIEDFIAAFADPATLDALERARKAEFEVVFQPYDWALNQL